jgi:hypothetical protein
MLIQIVSSRLRADLSIVSAFLCRALDDGYHTKAKRENGNQL